MFSIESISRITNARTQRSSSWDTTGRNSDAWSIEPGETAILADIDGPGRITHIWMTQRAGYRECLLKITWDDAKEASVLCPLGDFFGLGHGIVASYQSELFTASANRENSFNQGCALNCYAPMPFKHHARVELVNESDEVQRQYFYVDYELDDSLDPTDGYFHAEFRRENPFGGWGHEVTVNAPEANIVNVEREAWENNYLILDTKGRGHYLGCNLSVTNFQGSWWGEGDDMIWIDGYKWPPDLHGTGSEDYLNQAWGMQPNAFARNGSSIYEHNTNGYQTSYVHHIENPVRYSESLRVTIEHGHGNHLANEMSSVAYWYSAEPMAATAVPSIGQRLPVRRDSLGNWLYDTSNQTTSRAVPVNDEMREMKRRWSEKKK